MNLRYKITLKEMKSIHTFHLLSRDILINITAKLSSSLHTLLRYFKKSNCDFTFSDTYMTDNTLSKKINYSDILDIQVFDEIIFLITNSTIVINIPKRVFTSSKELQNFAKFINTKINKQEIDGAFSKSFVPSSNITSKINASLNFEVKKDMFATLEYKLFKPHTYKNLRNIFIASIIILSPLFLFKTLVLLISTNIFLEVLISFNFITVIFLIIIAILMKLTLSYIPKKRFLKACKNTNTAYKHISIDDEFLTYETNLESIKVPVENIITKRDVNGFTSYVIKIDDDTTKRFIINKLLYPIQDVKNFDIAFNKYATNTELIEKYTEELNLHKFKIKVLKIIFIIFALL